jgi:CRISPR type III-B/RAMP module-associated protein Cmr3
MMYLKITLKPLDAYFLGSERNTQFSGSNENSQLSEQKPYFIRSNQLPSQSALFGVLRYLGIQNPKSNFELASEDKDNIGPNSYNLLSQEIQNFGRIHGISPLLLENKQKERFMPAPRNRCGEESWADDKKTTIQPFTEFEKVNTLLGTRYFPTEYDEKIWDGVNAMCLEDGHLVKDLFQGETRIGINREFQRKGDDAPLNGFFKKEYIVLNPDYKFLFYADVAEDFVLPEGGQRVVYMGQGNSPFLAKLEKETSKPVIALPQEILPSNALTAENRHCTATLLSDLYYEDNVDTLKQYCSLMIAGSKDYRVFTTNYGNDKTAINRYSKHRCALRLLPAGSVFLFFGEDRQEKMEQFRSMMDGLSITKQAQIAGFNHIFYSDGISTY